MRLDLVPIDQDEAKVFIRQFHRHHDPMVGAKFQVAVATGGVIVGVAVAGRPSAIGFKDGFTLEITRTCVAPGHHNVNSMLMGACVRAAFALGYRRVITYTLARESGASLRAAGFHIVAEIRGREWGSKARPRVPKGGAQLEAKLRWELTA